MQKKTLVFLFGGMVALLIWAVGLHIPSLFKSNLIGGPSSNYAVVLDTVNDVPPTEICFVGPVTIVGHFTLTHPVGQVSQYNVEIDWGDGTLENSKDSPDSVVLTQTLNDTNLDIYEFEFTASHIATSVITSISLHLFHTQAPGNEGDSDSLYTSSVCIAPPTMAVLNVKKEVSNTNGGTASPIDFPLHLKDAGTDVAESPFNADDSTGKDFLIVPDAGPYVLSEDLSLFPNYEQTDITGDCSSDGSIVLTANNNYSCTISNSDMAVVVIPVTHTIVASAGSNGSLTPAGSTSIALGSDQSYTITPASGYHVLDVLVDSVSVGAVTSFSFTNVTSDHTISATFAQDSGGSPPPPPVNHLPVASNASVVVTKDTPHSIVLSASDTDGDTLSYSIVSGPQGGTPGILGTISGNTVTYTPATGFTGSDSFTFNVNDGHGNSNTATISITVEASGGGPTNHLPVANNASQAVTKNISQTITLSASDSDNDALTYSIVSGPQGSTPGTLSIISGNTLTYTPAANFTGADSFTFHVYDGQGYSNTATITITISSPSGGGGGGGSNGGGNNGSNITTVTTTTTPATSNYSSQDCTKELYLSKYLRFGYENDPAAVAKLQLFLNKILGTTIPVVGVFGPLTEAGVRTFQALHADTILTPWGLFNPTGIAYITTINEINNENCPALHLPIPSNLIPWEENPLVPKKLP